MSTKNLKCFQIYSGIWSPVKMMDCPKREIKRVEQSTNTLMTGDLRLIILRSTVDAESKQ